MDMADEDRTKGRSSHFQVLGSGGRDASAATYIKAWKFSWIGYIEVSREKAVTTSGSRVRKHMHVIYESARVSRVSQPQLDRASATMCSRHMGSKLEDGTNRSAVKMHHIILNKLISLTSEMAAQQSTRQPSYTYRGSTHLRHSSCMMFCRDQLLYLG